MSNLIEGSDAGAGTVLLRGGRLLVDNASIQANTATGESARLGIDLRLAEEVVLTHGALLRAGSTGAGRAGDVQLIAGGLHMDNSLSASPPSGSGHGGNITVHVDRFTLNNGAQISSGSFGAGRGGHLTIAAGEAISIAGRNSAGFKSGLFSTAEGSGDAGRMAISASTLTMDEGLITTVTEGVGRGGDLEVKVGRLTLTGGAFIDSSTNGPGLGGTVALTATDAVTISGRDSAGVPSRLLSFARDRGDMGRVTISAPALSMLDGGTILTGTTNAGRAGDVAVQVGRLTLTGGADISSHTFSGGPGGTVTVTATDAVTISGQGNDGLPSNPSSTATGRGDAGRVAIVTPTLNLDGGRIATATTGEGRAGDIAVEVGRLTLTGGAVIDSSTFVSGQGGTVTASDVVSLSGRNSGLFTRTAGSGPGGAIELRAQQVQLRDGGTISASSTGAGDAGTIRLQVGESFRSQNGAVTTATEGAGGGAIALTAGRLVQLQESDVTTSVRGGGGDAGNLTLDAPFIVADGSHIIANAFGGRGGNIRIGAEVFLADPASLVSASSELGISGTVDIQAPVTSLGGTLAALPQAFVNVAALLPARCAARWRGGKTSSLVLGGRNSLPLEPSGVLPSPLVLEERLATDPAGIGAPPQLPSPARFAFLADQEKALPRLQGSQPTTGCTK